MVTREPLEWVESRSLQVFGLEHFAPLAKGEVDSRAGAPVSMLGGGPDYFGYSVRFE